MKCNQIQKKLSDYIDGVLTGVDEKAMREHLKTCDACRREYDMLSVILQEAHELPEVQAPATLWNRIEADLDRAPVRSRVAQLQEMWSRVKESLRFDMPGIRIASIAFILLIGFLLGRYFFPMSGDVRLTQTDQPIAGTDAVQARAVNYIEKSKILFLGIVNADSSDIAEGDFSSEKEHAQNLIREASYLKDNVPLNKNARLRSLIDELELILYEIANLEEVQDFEDVELIKSGIDEKGLLLKINLHDVSSDTQTPAHSNSNI